MLDDQRVAARLAHRADARLHAAPLGQRGVEHLDVIAAHVAHDPLVENVAQKTPVAFGRDGPLGHPRAFAVGGDDQRTVEARIVKGQFHCTSSKTQYSGKPFIPIVTETLVLFQKEEILLVPFSIRREGIFQIQEQDSIALTWFHLLRMTLEQLNGHATLKQLYQELREHPKAKKNKNYEARIRATLYEHADCFLPLARGTFRLKYR